MMKKLLMVAIGAGMLCACAPAPPAEPAKPTAADEAKLKADSTAVFDYVAKGDAEAAANMYAEDALVMPDKAPALNGRAAVREFFTGMVGQLKDAGLTFKDNGANGWGISGDMAWLSGTYAVVDASGQAVDTGKYMSVHHRTNGVWLYIRDIWNSDTPPPAMPEGK